MDLRERIFRYLAACPAAIAGQEGHKRTFSVACSLFNGFALTESETLDYLRLYNSRCQPEWNERELEHKANSAANAQHSKARGHLIGEKVTFTKEDYECTSFESLPKSAPKKLRPSLDPVTAIEIYLAGFRATEDQLSEASPIPLPDDWKDGATNLLMALYRAGEKINFVTDYRLSKSTAGIEKAVPYGYGRTLERNKLLDLWSAGMPESPCGGWMRMNPLDGQGISDSNVTSHRFVLLEFDKIPIDLQLSLLGRMPLPIAAILTSGGRSVHAWVKSDSKDDCSYRDDSSMLLTMLSRFGLDAKNKNPSRLSRLAGVTRKLGADGDGRQRLLYLNARPQQERIFK